MFVYFAYQSIKTQNSSVSNKIATWPTQVPGKYWGKNNSALWWTYSNRKVFITVKWGNFERFLTNRSIFLKFYCFWSGFFASQIAGPSCRAALDEPEHPRSTSYCTMPHFMDRSKLPRYGVTLNGPRSACFTRTQVTVPSFKKVEL